MRLPLAEAGYLPLDEAGYHVSTWRKRMGLPVARSTGDVAVRNPDLHARLLREEVRETCEALIAGNVVEVADGLADVIVVALGCALDCGIDLSHVFDEVMRSNNTKTPGNLDNGGKLKKGPNYEPPRIAEVLKAQGWKP